MDGDPNQQEKANTARPRLEIELPPPIPAGRRVAPATGQQVPGQPPKPSTGGLRVAVRHAQERREIDQPTLAPESPPPHPDSSRTKNLIVADPAPPVPAHQANGRNQPHGDGFEPTNNEGATSNKPLSPKPPPPKLNGCLLFAIIGAVGFAIICLIVALSDGPSTPNVSQTSYSTTSQDTTNSQSALTPQSTPTPTPTPLPSHVVLNAYGNREPAPGYQWASDDPNDLRVIPKVTPTPTPTPLPPHVVLNANGKREPAPGYQWTNDDPNDFRVIPKVIPTPTPIPLTYYRCVVVNLPPGDFLNVRNEANSDAQILARLQPGTEVFWIPGGSKTVGGYRWVRILIGDSEGWIHANFLHLLPDSTQRMGITLIPFSWEGKSYQIRQELYAPIEKLAARLNSLKIRCAQIKTASVKKAEWERLSHEFDSGNRELKSSIQDAKVP